VTNVPAAKAGRPARARACFEVLRKLIWVVDERFVALGVHFMAMLTRRRTAIIVPGVLYSFQRAKAVEAKTPVSAQQAAEVLSRDLGEREYFVTGRLTTEIFDNQCEFVDPTNDTTGPENYLRALRVLFDPARSSVRLLEDIEVINESTLRGVAVLEGVLKLPWKPRISPTTVTVTYTRDPNTGLITKQSESWDRQPLSALIEIFKPSFVA